MDANHIEVRHLTNKDMSELRDARWRPNQGV